MQTPTREQTAHAALPGGRSRRRDRAAWWRYTRHLAEMVVAMLAGMALLGVAVAALGGLPGSHHPLIEYAWMGVFMAAPMVAWMRRRGHAWADGAEMTAAMLVPMFALVLPVELGIALPGLSAHALMVLAHVAMIAGMAALMAYRWDRYAGGPHRH
jgi:hypothetical protein